MLASRPFCLASFALLRTHRYNFAGESHHINDDLLQLARAVSQQDLPADVGEAVAAEVDTAGLLAALIAQLEGAIRFVGASAATPSATRHTLPHACTNPHSLSLALSL